MTEYTTLALLKSALKIPTSDTTRDEFLQLAIEAASRAIEDRCGRVFGKGEDAETRTLSTVGRVHPVRARGVWLGEKLIVPDIASSDFEVDGYPTAEADPPNCFAENRPASALFLPGRNWADRQVAVTAVWGWPAVPAPIQQACLLQALRLSRRPGSPEGIAGSAEWGLMRIPNLDPDVRALVEPYRLLGLA